jgi:transcriptional regulator with XRE-family HTH domain
MTFAKLLRSERKRQKMTVYRLAQLSGISKQGIAFLEMPGSDPKLSTLGKLANALGVSISEILPDGASARPARR